MTIPKLLLAYRVASTYICVDPIPVVQLKTGNDKYVLAFNDTRVLSMKLVLTIAVLWYDL
jgi:hypothetical protein